MRINLSIYLSWYPIKKEVRKRRCHEGPRSDAVEFYWSQTSSTTNARAHRSTFCNVRPSRVKRVYWKTEMTKKAQRLYSSKEPVIWIFTTRYSWKLFLVSWLVALATSPNFGRRQKLFNRISRANIVTSGTRNIHVAWSTSKTFLFFS